MGHEFSTSSKCWRERCARTTCGPTSAELLSSKQFAALTGAPAEVAPRAGGAFTTFGKLIEGRNIELIPNQRIVQAWRPASWEPGVYSIVRFELRPHDSQTTIILDHTGFPEGDFKHLEWGWNKHYWEPLKKTFS
jgi:activator of HSP90 ATPase